MEGGHLRTLAVGTTHEGKASARASFEVAGEAGYLKTASMVAEAALCLALDREALDKGVRGACARETDP